VGKMVRDRFAFWTIWAYGHRIFLPLQLHIA
jgi:hypothetical protein